MKVVTSDEMRSIDERTRTDFGIAARVLMERAGLAVAERVRGLFKKSKVIVLSGGGNNGGDGIVAARSLFAWGWNVRVLILQKEEKLSPDCLAQYRTAKKLKVPCEFRSSISEKDLHGAIVVDAIFGTGISRPVASPISHLIGFLNRSDAVVVSVDMPSGISSDSGEILGEAVKADYTVTFGLPKVGHLLHPGAGFTGRLFVEDIGFPGILLNSDHLKCQTVEKADAAMLVPERHAYSHKGDYGHVFVIAGSRGKTGAAMMTAMSCMRAGAGLVTLGVPRTLADIFQSRVVEEMVLPLDDAGDGTISESALPQILDVTSRKIDCIAIGPGIGVSDDTRHVMKQLVQVSPVPVVVDADGINALGGNAHALKKARSPVILTPHAGEMARLLDERPERNARRMYSEKGRMDTARAFAVENGIYLLLKGAPSMISDPEGQVFINTAGNPGMATAGSGDVLTGVVAGLLGQGLSPLDASMLGTYLHGLAGDIAAELKGMHSLIATDIIENLPAAFASLRNG